MTVNTRPEAAAAPPNRPAPPKPPARPKSGEGALPPSLESEIFREVRAPITVTLGETTVTVAELLALENGSVLKLDRLLNELVELRLNDTVIARGEIVAIDDHFGVRIVEVRPNP